MQRRLIRCLWKSALHQIGLLQPHKHRKRCGTKTSKFQKLYNNKSKYESHTGISVKEMSMVVGGDVDAMKIGEAFKRHLKNNKIKIHPNLKEYNSILLCSDPIIDQVSLGSPFK